MSSGCDLLFPHHLVLIRGRAKGKGRRRNIM